LLFPATGELRTYAWGGNAPLARYSVPVGDAVTDQEGASWIVERVTEVQAAYVYHGEGKRLPESGLADSVASHAPLERLLRGETDAVSDFDQRERFLDKHRERAGHPGAGFMGGRIDWLPHQLAVVQEVSQRIHPRVLLADEVGLGKTIEAGLILHHAMITGRAQRILVVVPDALVHQWFIEMLRRFHLYFSIIDETSIENIETENPFFDAQCILCSLDFLTKSAQAHAWAEAGEWDLVVVDEAHHLAWHPDEASPEYNVVAALAVRTPGLLLLTATPAQLGDETHFAQLQLLDPDRYPSLQAFLEEQQSYLKVAEQAEALRDRGEIEALRHVLSCHGPGRILFRNTREHIRGFPKRCAHPYVLKTDKAKWLQAFLEEHPKEKVLLITRTPEQVKALALSLQDYLEPPPVLFHEEQQLVERDRQAAWFADPKGARVMIASDIGGEGRNFQFVRHLLLYDLPHDPELIEQRIGRLDRIGQQAEFHIHLPVMRGEEEAQWMRWVHEGLGAFERPLSCGQKCFQLFRDRLDTVDETLIAETQQAVERFEEAYRSGPQRLIAWKHELEQPTSSLMSALVGSDHDATLLPFAEELWQGIGLEMERMREQEFLLKPGPFFKSDVSIREEGFCFTCDRSLALSREDLDLLTWDHPLIRDALEAVLSSPTGTAVAARSEELERPVLQALFVLEAIAPPHLHISRYFPPAPICITVDAVGDEVTAPTSLEAAGDITALLSTPRFRKEWLPDRLADASARAVQSSSRIIESAINVAQEHLDDEIQRLEDLKQVNDHVREEELSQLRQQKEEILNALDSITPRLDAVRLILPSQ